MKLFLLLVTTMMLLAATAGYKILVVVPSPSKSHNLLGKGMVNSLLKAGHQVTWVTPYPEKTPTANLTMIDVSQTTTLIDINMNTRQGKGPGFIKELGKNISTIAANTQAVREVLVKEQFDAVLTEWFLSDTDCGYAAVQQVPWIVFTGTTLHAYTEGLVDEVKSLSTLPFMFNNYPMPMNFWQRMANVATFCALIVWNWIDLPATTARYEEAFAPLAAARGIPLTPFTEAMYNISVLFVNSHPSFAPAQSVPPNVVDIAGFHIDGNRSPLPQDIKTIMDASPQGVVYFSMGSVLKSSDLPEKALQDLIKVFGDLPYTILWKFEKEIQGLPKNVHVRAWWPQPSVLAHPNIKLFITHGGLLSSIEAIQIGVPLLAIPVFGDQDTNADRAVRNGFARKVKYSPNMVPELKEALEDMLRDDRYYKQAKFLSKLFNARPVEPQNLITFYVELAIETKGAYHLRSKTYLYRWYQRWMLDIFAFLLTVLYILSKLIRKLYRLIRGKKQNKVKTN